MLVSNRLRTGNVAPRARSSRTKLRCQCASKPSYGIFIVSASPAAAEAVAVSGVDWICIDAQHGAVGYETLNQILGTTSRMNVKRIVRVGGPQDKFGIQQALDLGADGVMVPLINTRQDAEQAVSYCLYPPEGQRSVAYPVRAVYRQGVGVPALAEYLKTANRQVEVWLQVETKSCFKSIDDVLSVPGISCAFLGPADMGFSYGLHVQQQYDLPAMLASSELDAVYRGVLQACEKHGVAPGVFCLGVDRARQLAAQGYQYVGYDTDLGVLINHSSSTMKQLKQ